MCFSESFRVPCSSLGRHPLLSEPFLLPLLLLSLQRKKASATLSNRCTMRLLLELALALCLHVVASVRRAGYVALPLPLRVCTHHPARNTEKQLKPT